MPPSSINGPHPGGRQVRRIGRRWQDARTSARLIREAEALWQIDGRELHCLGGLELGQLIGEVPARQRYWAHRWLACYRAATWLTIGTPMGLAEMATLFASS